MDRTGAPIVLITGCRSGIGRQLAIAFASSGAMVLATARAASHLHDLSADYPNIWPLELDLDDPDAIARLQTDVEALTRGRLDYLINNAGIHYSATAMDLEMEQVAKVFTVNVFSVMKMCQAFVPMLRNATHGSGTIVQIGSVTRDVPVVWQGPYNATKAALSQYTKTLRLEMRPFGIEVVEIVTGYVQSDILRHGFYVAKNSLYLPIKERMEHIKLNGNKTGMPASRYADILAQKLLAKSTGSELWLGTLAWQIRLVVALFPTWLMNTVLYRYFRLEALEKHNK